jgi:DNA-binding response OmpR family regulator
MPPNILLVTEPGVGTSISRVLDEAGHSVQGRHTIASACAALEQGGVDLALVDPGSVAPHGAAVLAALRARTSAAIVMIDSGHAELGRLIAAGADDFLAKPFSAAQLRARVDLALTDRQPRNENTITVGGIRLDRQRRLAWLDGTPLDLSRREFDLLSFLAARAGQVVSRRELALAVWHEPESGASRTMDVHLSWLRRKLGDTAARPRYLHTVRGVGFRLAADAEPRRGSAGSLPPVRDRFPRRTDAASWQADRPGRRAARPAAGGSGSASPATAGPPCHRWAS